MIVEMTDHIVYLKTQEEDEIDYFRRAFFHVRLGGQVRMVLMSENRVGIIPHRCRKPRPLPKIETSGFCTDYDEYHKWVLGYMRRKIKYGYRVFKVGNCSDEDQSWPFNSFTVGLLFVN